MNIVILVGNIGKDPEVKKAGDGTVCRFSIAVSTREKDPTLWVDCEAWDSSGFQLATLISQHVRKGKKVTILGELREARWESEGVTRRRQYVRVANCQWERSAANGNSSDATAGDERPW